MPRAAFEIDDVPTRAEAERDDPQPYAPPCGGGCPPYGCWSDRCAVGASTDEEDG